MTQKENKKFSKVLFGIGEGVWGGCRGAKELLAQVKS